MMPFPDKEQRKKCWDSRDSYWECLEQNNEDKTKCQEKREYFVKECPNRWVDHFDRKRDYIKFKEKVQTADPVEVLKKS
ncbi:cytochrome c oxidase assembly factor 6 homolog [Uloborus diversus]|uniref:cytochrome c oxidase assembly factor 6 homolog n=1 Tax=Uloborus diversus TaxID=327109 RepID=UPI00240A7243|nr:cytochrome c oxidase assembly factor 6 homolog [Uloborus diversus]